MTTRSWKNHKIWSQSLINQNGQILVGGMQSGVKANKIKTKRNFRGDKCNGLHEQPIALESSNQQLVGIGLNNIMAIAMPMLSL